MLLSLKQVSDAELLQSVQSTLRHGRRCLVDLLQQLHEIESRRLHVARGHSSMFAFCLSLGFSEGEAYKRIAVARAAALHPVILQNLLSGDLHLTGAAMLAPHFTAQNVIDLMREARGKTKAGIQAILARLKPSTPCTADLRRLRGPRSSVMRFNPTASGPALPAVVATYSHQLSTGATPPASGVACHAPSVTA